MHRELFDRIVLVYNPANPRIPLTLAESVRDDLRRQLPDMPVTFQPTRYPGHARELAHAAAGTGRPLIIAVSGDGVYNEVVNGIMDVDGSSAVSAVAAGGNANDHRRSTRRMPLVAAIVDGRARQLDLLEGSGLDRSELVVADAPSPPLDERAHHVSMASRRQDHDRGWKDEKGWRSRTHEVCYLLPNR